jgi:hypothetical protein
MVGSSHGFVFTGLLREEFYRIYRISQEKYFFLTDLVARREPMEHALKMSDRLKNGASHLQEGMLLSQGNDKSGRINTLTLLDLLFVRNDG